MAAAFLSASGKTTQPGTIVVLALTRTSKCIGVRSWCRIRIISSGKTPGLEIIIFFGIAPAEWTITVREGIIAIGFFMIAVHTCKTFRFDMAYFVYSSVGADTSRNCIRIGWGSPTANDSSTISCSFTMTRGRRFSSCGDMKDTSF